MSVFTDIFSDHNRKITSLDDVCISKILDVLHFSQLWESEFETQDKYRHLITRETREDTDTSIYGFVNVVRSNKSDEDSIGTRFILILILIENWSLPNMWLM